MNWLSIYQNVNIQEKIPQHQFHEVSGRKWILDLSIFPLQGQDLENLICRYHFIGRKVWWIISKKFFIRKLFSSLSGFLSFDVDITHDDINQCDKPKSPNDLFSTFIHTHKCHLETSQVKNWLHVKGHKAIKRPKFSHFPDPFSKYSSTFVCTHNAIYSIMELWFHSRISIWVFLYQ